MISDANLDFWIKNHYNVIFRGKHGVGKTATILEAFGRHKLKWQYFSASTMDPWVDFIGVPKEKIDENGQSYLDLVRPKHFQNDEVEAIFLDEFNRSSKKVRNAVMELIQFKSINGKKFNNLKIIWAAINPEDDEDNKYDVEALDPAQLDRFHAIVDIPYAVHVPYFRKKYGPPMADAAATWWKELSKEQKDSVSPRRLDYALDIYMKGGDLKFVLPDNINTGKLLLELSTGSISKRLKELYENKDTTQAKSFLNVENNYAACVNYILKNREYQPFFLPLLSDERLVGLMNKNNDVEKFVFKNFGQYETIIADIATSKSSKLAKRAQKVIKQNKVKVSLVKAGTSSIANGALRKGVPVYWASLPSAPKTTADFESAYKFSNDTNLTYSGNRLSSYEWYEKNLPQYLSEEIAQTAITDLATIALNSQKTYTIDRKMKKLAGLLNHIIQYYVSNNKPIPLSTATLSDLSDKLDTLII